MIKRLTLFLIFMLTINSLSAQRNECCFSSGCPARNMSYIDSMDKLSRNLFIEFGGPSFGVGIGYDQRFKPNSVFGFRTGMSFTNGSCDKGGWSGTYPVGDACTNVDFNGVTFPLEINAIMGNRASKFELGVGATPHAFWTGKRLHIGGTGIWKKNEWTEKKV